MHTFYTRLPRAATVAPGFGERKTEELAPLPGNFSGERTTEALMLSRRLSHPWLALVPLCLATCMANLDITIVNVALPTLQSAFHTDLTTISWTVHIYALVFATFLITGGRLGDLYGRKRLLCLGFLVFLAGSICCGLAPSLLLLLIARAGQALGAATLSAVSLSLVHTLFPKRQRALAMSIFGSSNAAGVALGPLCGGLLIPTLGWRAIFFVTVPLCLLALLLVVLYLSSQKEERPGRERIDILGMGILSAALLCLVLAVIKGSAWGWSSPLVLSLFGWGLFGLLLFVVVERGQAAPMLDLHLFALPRFALATLATLFYSIALQGGNLFLVLYLLDARKEPPSDAALQVLPVALAACLVPLLASRLSRFFTPPLRCLCGILAMSAGLLLFCTLTLESSTMDLLWREALFGLGSGLCVGSFPTVALLDVPSAKMGVAGGTLNTFRQIGFVLGVALLVGLFSAQTQTGRQDAQREMEALIQSDARLPAAVRDRLLADLPTLQMPLAQLQDVPESTQRELMVLDRRAERVVEEQTLHAYRGVWALAALFPALGCGIVLILLNFSGRKTAWQTCYFFSLSGKVSARTVQHYLAAQSVQVNRRGTNQAFWGLS